MKIYHRHVIFTAPRKQGEQNLVAIAEQVLARRCDHDCIGNRGVTIAVVVPLPGLMDERRIQGKLQAVGGPIDRMVRRILVILEP